MTTDDYLKTILEQQTFADDDPEMVELRRHRDEIRDLLRAEFDKPSIRWAGSMNKRTMIRDSYDGDLTCYFGHEDTQAGETLEDIYGSVRDVLRKQYIVEEKPSALRVLSAQPDSKGVYTHVDVVPGRFILGDDGDVFLHRTTGDKSRLKTNLDVQIRHIRDSGVRSAIRLMKLWRFQNGLTTVKTFVLELLVVKLLEDKDSDKLEDQLVHVWTEFRDHPKSLSVEDPANPTGNDLKPQLDACRDDLSRVAKRTLQTIEDEGWEAVFGPVESDETNSKQEAVRVAASSVPRPSKPWLREE